MTESRQGTGGFGVAAALGGMVGQDLGPQAMRVKAGDSLIGIAKARLPPGSSAQMVAIWIEHAQKLNKLGPDDKLKPGQALLLPSLFLLESTAAGKATPTLNFLDKVDAEKILTNQEHFAENLSAQLKSINVEQRLKYYQASPPPAPEPSDLNWLQQLSSAGFNQILKYRPSQSELALKSALEKSLAWQQMVNQPTRLTRADLKLLPPEVQQRLQTIMTADDKSDALTSLDLAKASPQAVKELILMLKQGGYQPHEQRLMQVFADLSNSFDFGSYAFTDERLPYMIKQTDQHKLVSTDLKCLQANLQAVRALLNDPQLIQRGGWNLEVKGQRLISFDATSNTLTDLDISGSSQQAQQAREHLRKIYGFSPANPWSREAVKAFAPKLATPEAKTDFIQHYMNAFYMHPGDNTNWSLTAHLAERVGLSESIFFGDPPALDRLPDGRCLMDCEGFAKLSQLLLETLAPGSRSMPVKIPGHIFTAAEIDGKFYAFDVNVVQPLKLGAEEAKQFREIQGDYASRWNRLNPFRLSPLMSRQNFPVLYSYTDRYEPMNAKYDPHKAKAFKQDYMLTSNHDEIFNDYMP